MSKDRLYKNGVHNLQLDDLDIEALIDILVFAGQTAAYLANKEISEGRNDKGTVRLTRLAYDSKDLLKYLRDSLNIGEPSSDSLN